MSDGDRTACPDCGSPVIAGANYCAACGAPLSLQAAGDDDAAPPAVPPQPGGHIDGTAGVDLPTVESTAPSPSSGSGPSSGSSAKPPVSNHTDPTPPSGDVVGTVRIDLAAIVIGALLMGAGSLGTWASLSIISVDGTRGSDGKITLGLAICCLLGLAVAYTRRALGVALLFMLGVAAMVIGGIDLIRVSHAVGQSTLFGIQVAQVGWGLYAVVAGGASVAAGAGLMAGSRSERLALSGAAVVAGAGVMITALVLQGSHSGVQGGQGLFSTSTPAVADTFSTDATTSTPYTATTATTATSSTYTTATTPTLSTASTSSVSVSGDSSTGSVSTGPTTAGLAGAGATVSEWFSDQNDGEYHSAIALETRSEQDVNAGSRYDIATYRPQYFNVILGQPYWMAAGAGMHVAFDTTDSSGICRYLHGTFPLAYYGGRWHIATWSNLHGGEVAKSNCS